MLQVNPKHLEKVAVYRVWGVGRAGERGASSLVDKLHALGNGARQLLLERLQARRLRLVETLQAGDGLDAARAERHLAGEEGQPLHDGGLHVRVLLHALGARHGAHARFRKASGGVGHRQRGAAPARLSLDDLGARILDASGERRRGIGRQLGQHRRGRLAEQRQDGDACVAAHHRHRHQLRVHAQDLRHKLVGADHVQRRHAKELLRVVLASLLEHLSRNGHGGVDGIRDDGDPGVGAVVRDALHQRAHYAGVDVEQVVARHAGLARHAGRDHHQVAASEASA
mmetsp:Transcript_1490/g.3846  ORF Transcript_1490/g.3846 Transcript_1490/m.3846 type:complete len:284 (-) Transcript_1490:384-1235(-)